MKKIFLLIVVVCIHLKGRCDCGSGELEFWPDGNTISQNSIFVVEGYGMDQEVIRGLCDKYKIYLKCGNEKIALKLSEILEGEFYVNQAIMKPERILNAGTEYELIIEGIRNFNSDHLMRYSLITFEWEIVKWKVEAKTDTIPPVWNKSPVYKNDTWIEYGCGPEVSANFRIDAKDDSEFMVGARVNDIQNNTTTIYYIRTSKENIVSIGHGMCSGGFYLENGSNFTVEFSLMDASGNEIKWNSGELKFKKPTPPIGIR